MGAVVLTPSTFVAPMKTRQPQAFSPRSAVDQEIPEKQLDICDALRITHADAAMMSSSKRFVVFLAQAAEQSVRRHVSFIWGTTTIRSWLWRPTTIAHVQVAQFSRQNDMA
jgi:hypothetical protein